MKIQGIMEKGKNNYYKVKQYFFIRQRKYEFNVFLNCKNVLFLSFSREVSDSFLTRNVKFIT